MRVVITILAVHMLCCSDVLLAQDDSTVVHARRYELIFGAPEESEIFARAGLTLNKVFTDIYHRKIAHRVPAPIAPWAEIVWSINWSFVFTMWPHDGGHWARAQQVGGDFVITEFGYPFPVAEMRLPDELDQKEETLTSIGGHEINFLMRQQAHMDYYEQQYIYADELIHAFVQDVFYPFYAFVIAYADPTDPSVWTDTRGDPVESTLSVFKTHTGKPPIREDGSVDPELIDQYRANAYLSVLWPLLNPMFYRSLKAFSVDMKKDHGLMKKPWMLENEHLAWSWGTHFHPSPLGYELYLNNYFLLHGRLYGVYLKTGGLYKNNGIGIQIPGLLQRRKLQLGLTADLWDQDIFGQGGSLVLDARYRADKGLGVVLKCGWKSGGYLIGRRVDESALLLGGCTYRF